MNLSKTGILLGTAVLLEVNSLSAPSSIAPVTDRVAVVQLAVAPERAAPGEVVRVVMSIQNRTSRPLARVQWRILQDGQVLAFNIKRDLAAGETFEATATWIATPPSSTHRVTGIIDPDNALNEDEGARRNNSISREVVVNP